LDGVKTGELDGLLVQDPRNMGYQSVMMAIEAIGKAPASVKNVTTGVTLITPMNLQNPDIRKLLKP
jgi:ribose transport system substrate-binding protein